MNEPAFPSHYEIVVGSKLEENEKVLLRSKEGMTLRDYFAGQALIALHTCAESGYAESRARRCYEIADAMMEQRKVK